MKKIGIDGRLIEETGVGRYIRNLLSELSKIDSENQYIIFLRKKSFISFTLPNHRWQKRLADIPWHSFTEQLIMPFLLLKENLDLVHIPYFNVPIFYPGKYILTIHDLTIFHFDTGRASTLFWPFYKLRRLGYMISLYVGMMRARCIIAVSSATKQEILNHFNVDREKIIVTYEGVDTKFQELEIQKTKSPLEDLYFLYVGNAYPHKNLELMLRAFKHFLSSSRRGFVKFVFVGKNDFFYTRLKDYAKNLDLTQSLVFWGEAKEKDLVSLYKHAVSLVFPSLMEGFGLPALEAIYLGCPVIASDIAVFHEILGPHASYFSPSDVYELSRLMTGALNNHKSLEKRESLSVLSQYTWRRMAELTQAIYRTV